MNTQPIYVPLADVAAACGVSSYELNTRYWPDHWAVPRDWRLLPRSSTILVAEESLPDLVAQLKVAGLAEGAARLDAWRAEIATPEPHEDFVARHTAKPAEPHGPWFKKGQYE